MNAWSGGRFTNANGVIDELDMQSVRRFGSENANFDAADRLPPKQLTSIGVLRRELFNRDNIKRPTRCTTIKLFKQPSFLDAIWGARVLQVRTDNINASGLRCV